MKTIIDKFKHLCGIKETPMVKNTKYKIGHIKSIDAERGVIDAIVSTYQWDRMDERFAKGAWDMKNYLGNPVALWAHDASQPPIAKATAISETEDGLRASVQFDMNSPRASDIFRLYKEGFLSAFSVGFIPKKWVVEQIDPNRKGIVFTDAELLEFSAVPIPANPGALLEREQADFVMKALGDSAPIEKVADKEGFWMVKDGLKEDGPEESAEDGKPIVPTPTEPALEPTPEPSAELEKSLKYLIDLSKTAKASGLDKSKLDLVQQAVSVLGEILEANSDSISGESLAKLKEAVDAYAKAIEMLFPDDTTLIKKVVSQIDKALKV